MTKKKRYKPGDKVSFLSASGEEHVGIVRGVEQDDWFSIEHPSWRNLLRRHWRELELVEAKR